MYSEQNSVEVYQKSRKSRKSVQRFKDIDSQT